MAPTVTTSGSHRPTVLNGAVGNSPSSGRAGTGPATTRSGAKTVPVPTEKPAPSAAPSAEPTASASASATPSAEPSAAGSSDPKAELNQALSDAQTAMTDSDNARSKGDWAEYGDAQKRLNDAVNRAIAAQQKLG